MIWTMEKRSRGRPRTTTSDQKREAARERQQERRRRLAEDGGRSITVAVPGDLLTTLDAEAKRRGISKSELLLEAARVQIHGSGPGPGAQAPQIYGSGTSVGVDAAVSPPQIDGSGSVDADSKPNPGYRGRALLLAAAVGAVLGSWLTLLIS